MRLTLRNLVYGAAIAALYTLLTVLFAPISSGLLQCRISEALCVLPYFSQAAVPGLFLGCLLSNLLTGAPVYDVVFGSFATLLAAVSTWWLRKRATKYLAPLPSVLWNALIVGAVLKYGYGVDVPLLAACAYVGAGQALACFGAGLPLLLALERVQGRLFDGAGGL